MTGSGTVGLSLAAALVLVSACDAPVQTRAPGKAPMIHHKPQAPVALTLRSQQASATSHVVTAQATPLIDTAALEIVINGPQGSVVKRFRHVPAGATRELTHRVATRGAVIRASARVEVRPGFAPNRVGEISVGVAPVARVAPTRTIALPSGERIDEVRR